MIAQSEKADVRLYLCVVGSVRLKTASGEVLRLPHKAAALVTYFILAQTDLETKEFIKGLLWSESSQSRAGGSLRQCLKKLNDTFSVFDFQGFCSEGRDVSVRRDLIGVDLFDLYSKLRSGIVPEEFGHGKFSPEYLFGDLDGQDQALDAWLSVQRQTWSDKLLSKLEQQTRSAGYDAESGIEAARLIYALDRTHEEACRYMMGFYAVRENLGPVMEVYEQLCVELDEKFGTEPSTDTVELYLSIQNGSFEVNQNKDRSSERQVQLQRTPQIGVNEFQWSGASSDKSVLLASGFRKEMMAALSKFREWVIIDTQSREVSGSGTDELDYVLDGTCFQADEYTDVLVTVTEAKSGQLWSETPRIETRNWIAAQRTIVSKVAVALNVYLSTARVSQVVHKEGFSATAHEDWLTGYKDMLVWEPAAERRAEGVFRRIIDEVPDFAPAYSSLATILNSRHFKHVGTWRNEDDAKSALAFAQRAVELDALESRAQLALGFSYAMNKQFEQAQLHLTLARELNPHSPVTVVPCAHGLSYCGLHDEAVELVDWAESINWKWMPRFHWGYIMCVRFFARDFEGAIKSAQMADGVIVDLHGWHAAALALNGQVAEAKQHMKQFKELATARWSGDNPPDDAAIARWFLHCFPIRRAEDFQLLKEGLARAGLADTAPEG